MLGFFLSSILTFVQFSLRVQRVTSLPFAEVNCLCTLENDFLLCTFYLKLVWGVLACMNAGSHRHSTSRQKERHRVYVALLKAVVPTPTPNPTPQRSLWLVSVA